MHERSARACQCTEMAAREAIHARAVGASLWPLAFEGNGGTIVHEL